MKRRLFCVALVLSLMAGLCSAAFAAPSVAGLSNFKKVETYVEGQFSDVSDKDWYAANVKSSVELGLFKGTDNGFEPDGSITVAQAVTVAARIHSTYQTGSASFVQGTPWYQVYVDYAVEAGIIKAGEYSNFDAAATRAQFARIFAASVPESELNPINDIPVGSIHDLPASAGYADAVYLLYNAGVLTGSDNYGTFKADTGIKRSEAATIATRIVNPLLRKVFTPEVYDPYPPTGLTIRDVTVAYSYEKTELAVGRSAALEAVLEPAGACSSIVWASSDPAVAVVDKWGTVTAVGKGDAQITAKAYNGVTDTYLIRVPEGAAQLQYALTADGKGYEIVGCDPDAYTAHIPATYNGLPVVSIRGGAFMECSKLRYFTVDEAQTVFYEQDGVIFADLPEKTLICFPPKYDAAQYYYVPDGTVAVAPYGFAGIASYGLWNITLPESLTTLGDYAFAEIKAGPGVYVTDSLVNIGDHLLQGQSASMAFYGNWNSVVGRYAQKNQIPFSGIVDYDPGVNTTMEKVPQSVPAEESDRCEYPVKVFGELNYMPYGRQVNTEYDLTSYQEGFTGEVYMELAGQWAYIVPDHNGNTRIDMPPQTGLYGVGYTATEAVLRSYDRYGNLLATQRVNGNFAFCFPGAGNLGVVGGSETTLAMIPYEPVYLISGGNYPIQADEWYTTEKGSAYQFFIQQYPSGAVQQNMPNYLNVFVAGNYGYGSGETEAGYRIGFVELYDVSRMDELTASLVFDGQICVADNDEMVCLVNSSFAGAATFGDRAMDMWHSVKELMAGDYFPSDYPIQKIYIFGDGSWPSAGLNSVYMNEAIVNGEDDLTFAHEFVHAVDESIPSNLVVAPSAWSEGRAEYISNKIFGNEKKIYTGYDWSFLSEADKADFFRFYYFSTNRWTTYSVGTLFLRYLNETYGEDVSGKIMANLAALTEWDYHNQYSEANSVLFKQCVEAATEVGVFQNFVRDVIEK